MLMHNIKKWAYKEGKNTNITIPNDCIRDNLERTIQIEWVYLEESITKSEWWREEVLPELNKNRIGKLKDDAFQEFLKSFYNGYYDKFVEVFNAIREGEKNVKPIRHRTL